MKLQVLRYVKHLDAHECRDEAGKLHWVDLLVNGDFPKYSAEIYSELEGKTVEVDYLAPFIVIAHNVKVSETA